MTGPGERGGGLGGSGGGWQSFPSGAAGSALSEMCVCGGGGAGGGHVSLHISDTDRDILSTGENLFCT